MLIVLCSGDGHHGDGFRALVSPQGHDTTASSCGLVLLLGPSRSFVAEEVMQPKVRRGRKPKIPRQAEVKIVSRTRLP
jgi:hypothetical protein